MSSDQPSPADSSTNPTSNEPTVPAAAPARPSVHSANGPSGSSRGPSAPSIGGPLSGFHGARTVGQFTGTDRVEAPRSVPPSARAAEGSTSTRPAGQAAAGQTPDSERATSTEDPVGSRGAPSSPRAGQQPSEQRDKEQGRGDRGGRSGGRPRRSGDGSSSDRAEGSAGELRPNIQRTPIPNRRSALDDDLQQLLDQELAATDLDSLMKASSGAAQRIGQPLDEGQRVFGSVVKLNDDSVFIALGGPDEGIVALEQFAEPPVVGQQVEVMIRGLNTADGLYECLVPGQTVSVVDWSDLDEGSLVDAVITAANSGGLECTVGAVRGFIPVSQIAEYRVETPADFVGQRLACIITEANPRRKNLVLSRRAVLERERQEKRQAQLAQIHVGDTVDGVVRTIKDFGAFVDLGGLEGLIHVSRLSWDRITHPNEVLEVGQKVKVRIEKIDEATGKLGLSYRDLLEHPWDNIDRKFPVGTVVKGVVSRLAEFGAFVKLAPGIEGLIHVSELAHHRVHKVDLHAQVGQTVEVKVLSVDREQQRMSLSLRAVQPAPETTKKARVEEAAEDDASPRPLAVKSRQEPLRGGTGTAEGAGEKFGLKW